MIYVDASVVVAQLLFENRRPSPEFWREGLVSSRLLSYELWTTADRRGVRHSHANEVNALLQSIALVGMGEETLARALEPLPIPLRTLDALHLATADFLRREIPDLRFASYDTRLLTAARTMHLEVIEP